MASFIVAPGGYWNFHAEDGGVYLAMNIEPIYVDTTQTAIPAALDYEDGVTLDGYIVSRGDDTRELVNKPVKEGPVYRGLVYIG